MTGGTGLPAPAAARVPPRPLLTIRNGADHIDECPPNGRSGSGSNG